VGETSPTSAYPKDHDPIRRMLQDIDGQAANDPAPIEHSPLRRKHLAGEKGFTAFQPFFAIRGFDRAAKKDSAGKWLKCAPILLRIMTC
jgi:hypothetical protein